VGAPADEWNEAAAKLRGLPREERWRNKDVVRLFELAPTIAKRALAGHWTRIGPEDIEDLAKDLLAHNLHGFVDVDPSTYGGSAAAYFQQALWNRAVSWHRRMSRLEGDSDRALARLSAQPFEESSESAGAEVDQILSRLTRLEREVFAAIQAGVAREAIAERFDTSRANIDQIVSRARRRLRKQGFG
jgi:RNA polymerase sigma factor (sigma-70 family)